MLYLKRRRLLNTMKGFMKDSMLEEWLDGFNYALNITTGESPDGNLTVEDIKKMKPELYEHWTKKFDKAFEEQFKALYQIIKEKDDPDDPEFETRNLKKKGK